jgi:hypothetical protein
VVSCKDRIWQRRQSYKNECSYFSFIYLIKLHQYKVFQICEVLRIGAVESLGALVVDVGQEDGILHVEVEVQGVVPILGRSTFV